ncbi:MAG: flavodoxin domain-containing protein [Bacillales bacterium]
MKKIAVIYWTGTGNTKSMADIVCNSLENLSVEYKLYEASEFNSSLIEEYDGFAFGCPAMGAEVLEESEFQPMWDEVKDKLANKKTFLFGSWGWGDGEYMIYWENEAKDLGINLSYKSITCMGEPDDSVKEELENAAKSLL